MASDYVLFMRSDVVSFYRSLRASERQLLQRFFDFLERSPYVKGETTERDEVGRTVEVKFLGKFKVVYWPDHGSNEVKVLKLERLSSK